MRYINWRRYTKCPSVEPVPDLYLWPVGYSPRICYRRSVGMCEDEKLGERPAAETEWCSPWRLIIGPGISSIVVPASPWFSLLASPESGVTNHVVKGGTVNRPCVHVSHRKQMIECTQGRNVPVHPQLRLAFALRAQNCKFRLHSRRECPKICGAPMSQRP